ncbi:MAG: dCMP deaminase family protein [Candidatus Eisenbacteria sp.]|nr:dCMP deaminase family protein [Candidatus Eisenbacteria bacterium]
MIRPDWDLYFIRIALEVASRSTCNRAAVGAVMVRDNRILSTGYNGAPAGQPHCTDEGCVVVDDHCQRAVHAEINAIINASINGTSLEGATLYYWDSKGRYAQTMEDFTKLFPIQAEVVKAAGITRICGRGL